LPNQWLNFTVSGQLIKPFFPESSEGNVVIVLSGDEISFHGIIGKIEDDHSFAYNAKGFLATSNNRSITFLINLLRRKECSSCKMNTLFV